MRHRYAPIAIAAVAALLTLGSLRVGLRLDDFYERWIILGSPAYPDVALKSSDAFRFVDGNPTRNQRMINQGLLPWWMDPHVKAAFWKPVTVLTHRIDYYLWPSTPTLMHAQSIFWFALWIASASLLYRRIMRASIAATLAGLLYAVDHARAIPVAWIANRNAVLAALFGILAIHTHIQSRRHPRTNLPAQHSGLSTQHFLSPILLALSLLSAEAGIGAVGYLIAYAFTLDPRGARRGLLRLCPHLLVILAWRIAWTAQGYGVHAVDVLYTDPGANPLVFAKNILERAPLYMLGQWTAISAEIHLGLSARNLTIFYATAIFISLLVFLILIPLVRRSRVARFWALGMLLSTILICSAAPMNRHLIFIGLGAMGLLGQFLATSLHPRFWRGPLVRRAAYAIVITLLVTTHLIVSPIALAILARYPLGPDEMLDGFHTLPSVPDRTRDLIFVNHPLPMDLLDLFTARAVDHDPLPRSAQILAPASTSVQITRPDDRSLLVRPDNGFFSTTTSRLGYDPNHPPLPGQTLSLPSMKITILEMTPDARPAAVLFQFNVPLEDPSLQWISYQSFSFQEFHPAPIGTAVRLPASGLPF
jgi:hypothetical protein